ncbi:hypothetical protein [Streptomyces sp. NPDC050164]|uniref:hypothetical protein n=1 Tax=Streptomyces sp. NPDC050164 TaxID=3365605 RepID=UPI003797D9B1
MQHSKFAAALHLFDLFEPDGDERYYAPWRHRSPDPHLRRAPPVETPGSRPG